ncbi:MAG: aldo/keto reductase, partial [Allosphingosinicella sp.]
MTAASGARRLGLGTAQLGLDYGITNAVGRVPEGEAAAMLRIATNAGLDTLDTAYLYGNSERVIGRAGTPHALRIVTKTPKFDDTADDAAAAGRLRSALEESLDRLGRGRVDALLAHDADDLLGPRGTAIWAAMAAAREAGLVGRIGASVYD